MPLQAYPKEQREAVHRALLEQEAEQAAHAPPPDVRNVGAVLALDAERGVEFHYRARRYLLRRVPYPDGLRCAWIEQRIDQMRRDEQADTLLRELHALLTEAVTIMHRLAEPLGTGVRGWLARRRYARRNPFFDAEEWELAELLGFLRLRRATSRARRPAERGADSTAPARGAP